MKKIIAILLVMAVVAGFVFADEPASTASETHKLRIQSTVGEKLPAFQLMYGSEYNANAAHTNEGKVVFTNGEEYPETGDPTIANSSAVFDLSVGTSHAVDFVAILAKNAAGYSAKTTKGFTLKFSGGVFSVKKSGGDATVTPEIAVTKKNVSDVGITSISDPSDNSVTVQFSGKTVTEDNLALATAKYTYTSDKDIDMGNYFADVLLTVTTTN